MRAFLLHVLLPSLALVALAPVVAHATVQDCRDLLFVFVDEDTCAQPTPCAHPDVVAADECFAQDLLSDPTDEEAHFFRALTRILRYAEEQKDVSSGSATFQDSLKETMDQAGLANVPKDHQVGGPNESGRSIFDFTAAFPRSTDPIYTGEADGSISNRDALLIRNLEAGDYTLAVASCCGNAAQAVAGEVSFTSPLTVSGNQLDLSDRGAYRVTISGPTVPTTVVDGELDVLPSGNATEVEYIDFTVPATGAVFIDVLSWEFDETTSMGVDVNGDGENVFISSEIFLFRDDGSLDVLDFIDSNNGSSGPPVGLPADAPTGGDVQQAIDTIEVGDAAESQALVGAIDASVADLDAVTPALQVILTSDEIKAFRRLFVFDLLGATKPQPFSTYEPVEIDYGDAKFSQAMLLAVKASLLIEQSTDLDFDIDEITPFVPMVRVQAEVIDANPNLFTLRASSGGGGISTDLPEAKNALGEAIDEYLAASKFIRKEDDDQGDDLVTISDPAREAEDRFELLAIQRSLGAESAFLCSGTNLSWSRLASLNRFLGTTFDSDGTRLDLGIFFDTPADLRPQLPAVQYDFDDQKNRIPRATFPDNTFRGVLVEAIASSDCDGDGVPDNEDLSPLQPNGPDLGTCIAGDPDEILEICMTDAECGSGGDCSLDQEDGDGDGAPDVADNCLDVANPSQADAEAPMTVVAAGSDFVDQVEQEARILVGNPGPLVGEELAFACGTCDVADFSDSVIRIGGGFRLCGYVDRIPRQIVQNDDPLCARSIKTGALYDIDLVTFRGSDGTCTDNDATVSCQATLGNTSYVRNGFSDGFGTACDCDFDSDLACTMADRDELFTCFGELVADDPGCAVFDMNGDGGVGQPDYSIWLTSFGGVPGPSILVPESIPPAPEAVEDVVSSGPACGIGMELLFTLVPLMLWRARVRGRSG